MRAQEFIAEVPMGGPEKQHRELEADGGTGAGTSWQEKFKDKVGVELPPDAVIASGMTGKKLYDPKKEPEPILKKPGNDSAETRTAK